jgi:uncharacterized phage protein (TIGR01671 family)
MNREIKFRVWNGMSMQYNVVVGKAGAFYARIDPNDSACLSPTTKYDDSVPVMQYTGQKDKNGRDVYEGDIVKIHRTYVRPFVNSEQKIDYKFIDNGEIEIGQIVLSGVSQKYLVSYEHIRYDDTEDFDMPEHAIEVIGNIYENPELLNS